MADDGFISLSSLSGAAPAPQAAPSADAGFIPLDQVSMGHPQAGPSDSLATDIPRRLATAGTDALGTALSIPRLAAQAVDWGWNKLGVNSHSDQALGQMQDGDGRQLFPDPAAAREMAYNTTGATEYVPATAPGRYLQAGLSAGMLGGAGGVGGILPAIGGGAAAEAAGELMPEHPLLARAAGFALGAKGAAGIANTATKAAGMATGLADTSPLYQAYQRQSVPTTLAGDVTQNPALQRLQSIATKMPGGEEPLREAGQAAVDAWQTAAEKTAGQLGPASSMQEAGTSLQGAAQNWLQDWKDTSRDKWQAFHQMVPSDTPIGVPSFQKTLADVNDNFGGATELGKALQPGLAAKLQGALASDVSPQGTLPWQGVSATRSALGELLSGAPVADAPQAAIKRLYGALSDDMRTGAAQQGAAATKAFQDANAHTAFGHSMLEDHLNPVLNATNPEAAAQYALGQVNKGGSRLAAMEFTMPGQPANLGAAVLRQAAENGPGGLPTRLKNISPEAQNQLFNQPGATPGDNPAYQGVNDLSDIAQAMRRTVQTTGNNSNTSAHSASGLGRVMSAVETAKMGREVLGTPGAIGGAMLGAYAPTALGAGARMLGANPLMSRLYSTTTPAISAPGTLSPNALLQMAAPDRRALPGTVQNALLPLAQAASGNAATGPRR